MVISSVKEQLTSRGVDEEEADTIANVYVPLGYPFPNAGKILALLFIPFAAWFVGRPLAVSDYPALMSVGLLALFGSPVAAIPFLLDMLRLPQDVFPLFLVAGIWASRLGDVLGAMHLTAFTLLCAGWSKNLLKLNPAKVGAFAGVASGVLLGLAGVNHFVVEAVMAKQEPSKTLVENLDLKHRLVEIRVEETGARNPAALAEGETRLDRIQRTKILRVGYQEDRPPFCFRNGAGSLVGMDIDLMQRLAFELGAQLELVPYREEELAQAFERDHFDLAVGGILLTLADFESYKLSKSYLEMNLGVLLPDHEARRLRDFELYHPPPGLRLGYVRGGGLLHAIRDRFAGLDLVKVESHEAFARGEIAEVDGLLIAAEVGAYLTMLHPNNSLVIPTDARIRIPIAIAITPHSSDRAERFLDTWVDLRRKEGTLDGLYDHWILGKEVTQKQPRWSVIRNVLGWVP
jgi:ABC-type amino acid transport substrate-binding protein